MIGVRALAAIALIGAAAGICRAEDGTNDARVDVRLENLDGKARFTVVGQASYLPDGTLLHVSLQVRDHLPVIEAGLFRLTVKDGKYQGVQEWPNKTFAPLAYRTAVVLHMDMQSPANKRFLSRELGYTTEQVETISAVDTLIGTEEERAAFMVQTLRTLRDYLDRVTARHTQLVELVEKPANDPAWTGVERPFYEELKRILEELRALEDTRVVWYDIGTFVSLNQAVRQISRALRKHRKNDPTAKMELNNTANGLKVVRDEIASRLPAEPTDAQPPAPPPAGGQ
jgi:hypothetical protein